jgi:hypothetical protein
VQLDKPSEGESREHKEIVRTHDGMDKLLGIDEHERNAGGQEQDRDDWGGM